MAKDISRKAGALLFALKNNAFPSGNQHSFNILQPVHNRSNLQNCISYT